MMAPKGLKKAIPVYLLDGNVLYALIDQSHVHHEPARRWFLSHSHEFATCPITQGTLVRLAMRIGNQTIEQAIKVLGAVTAHAKHRFWADTIRFDEVRWTGVIGHRQVTDAYLASLARNYGGKLATFDKGLASLHRDIGVAINA
jgi:toxin-antitoxin system PIN domain toxin